MLFNTQPAGNRTMRVTTRKMGHYPWYLKPFFWKQKRRYGEVLLPGMLWARVPLLFSCVALLYGVLDRRRSPISAPLRSLVTVRVSQINWCAFCVDINSATLAKRCGSWEKVQALANWRDSALYSDRERAVLAYTDAVTDSAQQVTDEIFQALSAHFDEDGIVEITALIAFQNLSSKFNSALDVPAGGFCRIPPDHSE